MSKILRRFLTGFLIISVILFLWIEQGAIAQALPIEQGALTQECVSTKKLPEYNNAVTLDGDKTNQFPVEPIERELFVEGSVIPVDTVMLQVADDDRIGFLQGVIMRSADKRGTYMLRDVLSAEYVLELPVVFGDGGSISVAKEVLDDIPEDLAAILFNAGCGRWWKGRNNYWRICTGSESGGGDGSRGRSWYTQLVSRDRCESQNTCPKNSDLSPTPIVFREDLPLSILLPPDEKRYCCSLSCPTIDPQGCTSSCTETPVGPCQVFTVNCGEGGCTWD